MPTRRAPSPPRCSPSRRRRGSRSWCSAGTQPTRTGRRRRHPRHIGRSPPSPVRTRSPRATRAPHCCGSKDWYSAPSRRSATRLDEDALTRRQVGDLDGSQHVHARTELGHDPDGFVGDRKPNETSPFTRIRSPSAAASTAGWICVEKTPGPAVGATTHTFCAMAVSVDANDREGEHKQNSKTHGAPPASPKSEKISPKSWTEEGFEPSGARLRAQGDDLVALPFAPFAALRFHRAAQFPQIARRGRECRETNLADSRREGPPRRGHCETLRSRDARAPSGGETQSRAVSERLLLRGHSGRGPRT